MMERMESEAVRVIVVRDDQLLVVHRHKFGREYYTLVGGHIEAGETPEAAMLREVDEETGLQLGSPRLVYEQAPVGRYNKQYIFLADYEAGEISMRDDADEAKLNEIGENTFQPMWLPVAQLPQVPFLPPALQEQLIHDIAVGFPAEPIVITPKGVA
jgi:8-oxo-dGTP pyrophosphatase MutT (NUDIX family)